MKKVLAIVLTLSMMLSLIACSGGNSGKSGEDIATTEVSTTEEAAAQETGDEAAESEEPVSEIVINKAEVTFPKVSEERLAVETEAKDAVNLYLTARMYLDKFLQYDIESGNPEGYAALLDSTIEAFENVGATAEMLGSSAKNLERQEANAFYLSTIGEGSYVMLGNVAESKSGFWDFNPFLVTVYAAEESEAVKWARDITERFDNAPAGKGIRTLAEQMGTDAKHAYAQLKQAQDILAGDAYGDFAETANAAYKTAKVLKTAGTAAQLTLSIVTADPVTTTEAVMACGGILMNGINTMLEVGQTGSVLFVGEDNKLSQTLENMEDSLAPIGSAIGLYGLGSNLAKGKKLIDDVPAMADSMMYIGSSIYDYMADGKILGGSFKQAADGTISCDIVDTMTFKTAWAKEPEAAKELLDTVGYSEEEIAKVVEKAVTDPTQTPTAIDPLAEIPLEQIESVLTEMSSVLPENYELSEEAQDILEAFEAEAEKSVAETGTSVKEDGADSSEEETGEESSTKEEDVAEEAEAEEQKAEEPKADETQTAESKTEEEPANNGVPATSEIAGYYPFYMYMTFGDMSGEAEGPQTITNTGGNNFTMTDVDGYSMSGTYDENTGVATFSDSDGTPVKVTFSYRNGKVHADLKLVADYGTMSGSVDKR